jgi:hypothetical protein
LLTTTLRATVVAGILTATALIASPLTAVAADEAPHSETSKTSGPNLADDMLSVPAAEKAMRKLARSSDRLAAASQGVHYIYVSVLSGTTKTTDDDNGDLSEPAAVAAIAKINAFWSEQSNGAVSFAFGGYESSNPSANALTCNPDNILDNEAETAFDGDFSGSSWVGSSNHLLVLTREKAACKKGAGFGTVGGDGGLIFSASGLESSVGIPVLYHEYGHNLGLGHADAAICRTASVDAKAVFFQNVQWAGNPTKTSAVCASEEYGDLLDIMGYTVSGATPHASALERTYLGWSSAVSPIQFKEPTASGGRVETLVSLGSASGARLIAITDPRTGERYYIEYRSNSGRDATSTEFANSTPDGQAVYYTTYSGGYTVANQLGTSPAGIVRVLRSINKVDGPPESTVLAVTPSASNSKVRLTQLQTGKSFTSVGGGTNVFVRSIGANSAQIKVTLQKYASTTTFSMKSKVKRSKAKATVTVKVVGGSKPAGTITAYNKGKKLKTYTISTSKNGKITVTLPKLKKGKAKITFKYNGNSKIASDISPAKSVKVK